MPFTGLVRRALPRDLLAFSKVSSVSYEFPFTTELGADAFYKGAAANAKKHGDSNLLNKYVAEFDEQVIAGLCATPYIVQFDGTDMRMCGIGGVCTLPTHRRLGAVRAMLKAALSDNYDKGVEWSFLYPFSQSYYEKFGYALSEPEITWSFDLRYVAPFKDNSYKFSLYEGEDGGLSGFREAYENRPGYNMMVRRECSDYGKVINADPYKKNDFAYLCRDAKGKARGYAVWHKQKEGDNSIMQMTELVFDEVRTLHAILGFATCLASDYQTVRFNAPGNLNLEYLCSDYISGHLQRTVAECGMARVVHLENALRGAKLLGSGEAVLEINDAFLEKQSHIGIRWRNGQISDIGASSQPPDATLSVGAFSMLLLGRYNEPDYPYVPGAEFIHPEKLTGLFYKKPIHIQNYF